MGRGNPPQAFQPPAVDLGENITPITEETQGRSTAGLLSRHEWGLGFRYAGFLLAATALCGAAIIGAGGPAAVMAAINSSVFGIEAALFFLAGLSALFQYSGLLGWVRASSFRSETFTVKPHLKNLTRRSQRSREAERRQSNLLQNHRYKQMPGASLHPELYQDIAKLWRRSGQGRKNLEIVFTRPGPLRYIWNSTFGLIPGLSDKDYDIHIIDLEFSDRNFLVIPVELLERLNVEELYGLCAAKVAALEYNHQAPGPRLANTAILFITNLFLAGAAALMLGSMLGPALTYVGLSGYVSSLASFVVTLAGVTQLNRWLLGDVLRSQQVMADIRAIDYGKEYGADPDALLSARRKLHILRTNQDPEHDVNNPDIISIQNAYRWATRPGVIAAVAVTVAAWLASPYLFAAVVTYKWSLNWTMPNPRYADHKKAIAALLDGDMNTSRGKKPTPTIGSAGDELIRRTRKHIGTSHTAAPKEAFAPTPA